MDQCGQESKLLKLAYQKNKFYGRSFALQTKPKVESDLKESQAPEMIFQANTRKMGVRHGTKSYQKVVLEEQRRKLR